MDVSVLLLELGALLVVLAVAARVGHRLGFSPIPLYLLVGLALGEGGLYPLVTAERFVEVGAEIGVVLLLLVLGLEYTTDELLHGLRTGAPVAVLDLLANFTPGVLAGLLLGWPPLAAVLLGGITYVSSSGIAAKLIDDLGWLGNRETPMVLSVLVAEDLVMAVYLPLVGALLAGGSAIAAGASAGAAIAVAIGALVVALRWGGGLSRVLASRSNEAVLLGVLGTTLLAAGVAERLHISAAVGAFLVGIAFSGPLARRGRGLLDPLRDLFAATFFVFFGLGVDPGSLPRVLPAAAALALLTAGTKLGTAWIGGARRGLGTRARLRAAATLVGRGEFSIVVAELGVAAGSHADLQPLSAAYVLLLAISAPLVARRVAVA